MSNKIREKRPNKDAPRRRRGTEGIKAPVSDNSVDTANTVETRDADKYAGAVFSKPLQRPIMDSTAIGFFRRVAPTMAFGIILYVLLNNLYHVSGALSTLMTALTAVFVGMVVAFVLNIPLRLFERRLFRWIGNRELRRGISMTLCYIIFVALGLTLVFVAGPQLADAIEAIGHMLPEFGREFYSHAQTLVTRFKLDPAILENIQFDWNSIAMHFVEFTSASMPQLLSTTRNITSSVTELFIGFILSAYMLYDKERIANHGTRFCRAIFKRDWADRFVSLCSLALATFRGYISGLFIEACILGGLTAGLMTLFGFPMPGLAGFLMGAGALVPIFGIFVMITVNTLLITAQTNIYTGLWFLIFIIVLQQLEGNLIYPRVMGSAIRLPGIWVLTAATVGGMLFGLGGLLISVPCASMLYSLARAFVMSREKRAAETGAAPGDL